MSSWLHKMTGGENASDCRHLSAVASSEIMTEHCNQDKVNTTRIKYSNISAKLINTSQQIYTSEPIDKTFVSAFCVKRRNSDSFIRTSAEIPSNFIKARNQVGLNRNIIKEITRDATSEATSGYEVNVTAFTTIFMPFLQSSNNFTSLYYIVTIFICKSYIRFVRRNLRCSLFRLYWKLSFTLMSTSAWVMFLPGKC